jgi:hypothetical protein
MSDSRNSSDQPSLLIAIEGLVVGAADQDAAQCAGPRNQLLFR